MSLLPGIAVYAKLEKASGKKQVLKFGNPNDAVATDHLELFSHEGCITLGLVDSDHFTPPRGFWEKLGTKLGELHTIVASPKSSEFPGESEAEGSTPTHPSVSPFPSDSKTPV